MLSSTGHWVKLLVVTTLITESPSEAAKFIKNGCIVAFPTETVYGLGASVFDETAVEKIFKAKQRPADNPLIAHVANLSQIRDLTSMVGVNAEKFIEAFFPGPLTLVLPKSQRVPFNATAALETIGVRMPRHARAHEFLLACGVPVVAPSANLSGRPSPTTWKAVLEDLDGRIDCILQGEATEIGLESTVVDCSSEVPFLLRQGAISLEQLRAVVPETGLSGDDAIVRSPGVKHKHYKPRAEVFLVNLQSEISNLKSESSGYIGLTQPELSFDTQLVCGSAEEYAHSVFEFFRECDRRNIRTIYCEEVSEVGIGAALMDRLRRASKAEADNE